MSTFTVVFLEKIYMARKILWESLSIEKIDWLLIISGTSKHLASVRKARVDKTLDSLTAPTPALERWFVAADDRYNDMPIQPRAPNCYSLNGEFERAAYF